MDRMFTRRVDFLTLGKGEREPSSSVERPIELSRINPPRTAFLGYASNEQRAERIPFAKMMPSDVD